MRLSAPALLLCIAASSYAGPFVAEPLVKVGDTVEGLTDPVVRRIFDRPTINSHGEWAVSVSSGSFFGENFSSIVLGNNGPRILSGFLPNGEQSPDRLNYRDADLNDHGVLAVGISWIGANRLGIAYVGNEVAVLSPTGNTSIRQVRLNNAGYVQFADATFTGQLHGVASRSTGGAWQQALYLGLDLQTPVGRVVDDINDMESSAVGPDGSLLYSALFEFKGEGGALQHIRGLALNDEFIALSGESSDVVGFNYDNPGASVAWNDTGDFAFWTGIASDESPAQFGTAIVSGDGSPLITNFDSIDDLNAFGSWSIAPESLSLSRDLDVLWLAISDESISPDVPKEFGSDALVLNDTVLVKTGDVMPDGALIYDFLHWELSQDGRWAIVTARAAVPGPYGIEPAVYRFQIPTPGSATLLLLTGTFTLRRKR